MCSSATALCATDARPAPKDSETQFRKGSFKTQLSELVSTLKDKELHASPALEIAGLALDSRAAGEGDLFFAVPGAKEDGYGYIAEAAARGAVCAVCMQPPQEEIPYILVPDVHEALALCAAVWYGTPAGKMTMVGVTGTNGKTTTTYLIKQLLERTRGAKVGLIGTNQNMIGGEALPAERTTPDALSVQRLLARMADAGCQYVVMEVSSHALVQRRVAGIRFRVGIFTNLTQDHLDYHGTMEAYCDAKALLFDACDIACVNGDDAWTQRILAHFASVRHTYGQNMTNDLVGWRARYDNDRVRFTACTDLDHEETAIGIPGGFSLYNALAALCAVQALGVPLSDAAKALTDCVGVKGRCEVVPLSAPFTVIIDYAHTPDGLKNILSTVCGFADGRVIALFGCGGDRDRTKRPRMGTIAAALADFVVLTSDNPRTENPYEILRDVLPAILDSRTPFAVIENRREAIGFALREAEAGDVVVLCGKGHETYQEIGTTKYHLDEREVVREQFAQVQRKEAAAAAEDNEHADHHCEHPELCGICGHGAVSGP